MLRYSPSLGFRPAASSSPNAAVVRYESRTADSSHVSDREHTEPSDVGVADRMMQSRLQSMLEIVRKANRETGAAVPLGEFLEQIQRERDEFDAALENLVASAAARLTESLVQALLDSQPASNSLKATQTDALQTTTSCKSEATQIDALQAPNQYGSKATQTDTPYAPTPEEGCKKAKNPPVHLPMVQQSPRGSRADQTDIAQPMPIQPVSESIRGFPEFGQEKLPRLLELLLKRTLPDESFTPRRVQPGPSDEQDPPTPARLKQADPDFNIGNGSVSVKSTIDEAMERYHSQQSSQTPTGARTIAPQTKQMKPFTKAFLGINSTLKNKSTITQTWELAYGKSPLEGTADRHLNAACRDMTARSGTLIVLPYGSTSMLGLVMGPSLRTINGVNAVNRLAVSEAEGFDDFSTSKAAGERLPARGELIVCLPGYAPLYLTPPTAPRRNSADVISISRKEMEIAPNVQILPNVTCSEMVEEQELKSTEVFEVVANRHSVNGYNHPEKEPKLSLRKSLELLPQKNLLVENAGPDRFRGLLDLVKRK